MKLENIVKCYGSNSECLNVLDGLSFELRQGEILCLLGPSGCGKTTLLNIMSGLEHDFSGTISFNKHSRLGYVPQKDLLLPWRTVLQNIALGLEIEAAVELRHLERIQELSMKYGIGGFLEAYPDSLSGGMRQIASFLRTLVIEPDLFLFDEPFASIDYDLRLRLENDLVQMIKKTSKTAIFVTHSIDEAVAMANRIIVLSRRPARILDEFEVHFPNEPISVIEARIMPEFQKYFARTWALLDREQPSLIP